LWRFGSSVSEHGAKQRARYLRIFISAAQLCLSFTFCQPRILVIVAATSLSFRYSAGYGVQAITVFTAFQLNDNNWHQVYAERDRLESLLMIDEQSPSKVTHPANVAYRPFIFSSPMVVGRSML